MKYILRIQQNFLMLNYFEMSNKKHFKKDTYSFCWFYIFRKDDLKILSCKHIFCSLCLERYSYCEGLLYCFICEEQKNLKTTDINSEMLITFQKNFETGNIICNNIIIAFKKKGKSYDLENGLEQR